MKERKTRKTLPAMTGRICAALVFLWLVCMYAITSVAAEGLFVTFSRMGEKVIEYAWQRAGFERQLDGDREQPPGYETYVLWNAMLSWGVSAGDYNFEDTRHRPVLNTDAITADTAAAVFDADGRLAACPSNFFTFHYCDEADFEREDVLSGNSHPEYPIQGYAVCVLDRQFEPEMSRYILSQSFGSRLYESLYHRFTGVLDEAGYFTLYRMESYLDSERVGEENGGWHEWPGYGIELPEGVETVTLYTDYVQTNTYTPSRSFLFQGERMADLTDYLRQFGPGFEYGDGRQYGFMDFLCANARFYRDLSGWDGAAETLPPMEYKLVTALLASPWRSAVSALLHVYIFTFLILLLGILWLRKALRRQVAEPVAAVNRGIAEGWSIVRSPDAPPLRFSEQAELLGHYDDTRTTLSRDRDTIARLERAVSYAQDAEETRRQMTANIAHELKTPLAVIHSYAEGLRERIAEEKRDKYLDIILSETERMDGMVLEMLDLSRLEAGKVKLSREPVPLSKLTARVFERLECAAEAKELNITYALDGDCAVNADALRIEQVITNFAVNAIKYTPRGGKIHVSVSERRGEAAFTIENDSPPLSSEALSKVWGTFYRGEESRTGDGTGLGLAIAKSIIDLHGGRCSAWNTKTGVKFSFVLKQ